MLIKPHTLSFSRQYSGTTWISRYQTIPDFNVARDVVVVVVVGGGGGGGGGGGVMLIKLRQGKVLQHLPRARP